MKIILFTNQDFLEKELRKSKQFLDINILKNFQEIYNLNLKEKFIFIHHLDCESSSNIQEELKENFLDFILIALRNNTNNIEGCTILKKGYKAYAHSLSNVNILDSIIQTVQKNNTWVYPELMQFLIQSVPLNDSKQKNLLQKVTIKELEVLELVAQGLSNQEISKVLDLAEVTVKKHISSLFKKLEVKDRLSLALIFKNS